MKKFLFLISMFFICTSVYAQEELNEVHLDVNYYERHNYKQYSPDIKTLNIKDDDENNEDYIYHPMKYLKDEAHELYSQKKFTDKKEKKFGKAKVGAKFDTTVAPDSAAQKRTLYTNYDLTEKMSVGADYQTNSLGGIEEQTKGTVGIGPEYKLNEKIKLKNKYSKNLGTDTNKGEVSVEYKPFKDGRMDFNAGAAQTQQDYGPGSSQVNFGTNIRF